VTAVDADSAINAKITYSIKPGRNSTIVDGCFTVDSNSGEVRLTAALTSDDVNASYVATITATDGGAEPLSTSVRLCADIVDRNVSESHFRSVSHRWLATGSLVFDATALAALLGSSTLCALIVVVVGVVVLMRRCMTRTRRHRQLNDDCKNPSRYKLVDVWNGTHDDEVTENRQSVNDDNNDGDGCAAGVPRTVIRTLDCSPRSCRTANTDVGTQRCCGSPLMWQCNSPSTLKRHEPDGRSGVSLNHFDLEPSYTSSSVV